MAAKDKSPKNADILAVSGLNGKSVTSVNAHIDADILVIEIGFSGGSTFIKTQKGVVKVGGNASWETGTVLLG